MPRVPRLVRLLPVFFMAAAAPAASAGIEEDRASWEGLRIKEERPLLLDTALVSRGETAAAIVPAQGEPWASAAAQLQRDITAKSGVALPILAPGDVTEADWARRNLIVIGNLVNNAIFARLYFNYFACADAACTGRGGYELRTVHDPWGAGRNAVVLGAQDADGLAAGGARLAALLHPQTENAGTWKLSRLMELNFKPAGRRSPLQPNLSEKEIASRKNAMAAIYARPGTERSAAHETIRFAMLYHRTGDSGWLELYRDAIQRHMNYYATNEYILAEGPRRYDRDFRDSWAYGMVIAWDLLEEAPGWSEEDRLNITNHVLRMVWESNLYQRWDRPASIEAWKKFDSITHNHHTWPGLANLFGGWYFSRHYKLPVANDWLEIALGMFRSCSRSWKPWEDSAGYQWIPQRHVLTYALASGDRTFIEEGHAQQTGKAMLQALDSLGRQPAWGDCGGFTSASGMPELLCALEYATGDGRYRWAIDWLGVDARDEMEAPFWTSVQPKRPDDLSGVAVTYLPPRHYQLFGRSGRSEIWQKPNLPFQDTFDKLTLRGGWAADDDYLMLDGTAAGSHGHLDANCIIAFTAAGAQWLVDAEYIRRIPKYHCGVTVLRDGAASIMPPSARLDHAVWFGNGALTRTTLPGYNGVTWTRNLIFVPKRYVAVIDELTAEAPGQYSLRCSWRVAGESRLEGDTLRTTQAGKHFVLRNLSGQRQELFYMKDFAGLPIHHLQQRASAFLKPGQSIRFVNVFRAGPGSPPALDARLTDEGRGVISLDGKPEVFGVLGLDGALTSDAALYRLNASEAWLAGATRLAVGGRPLFESAKPSGIRLDARGVALAEAQPVPAGGLRPSSVTGSPKPLSPAPDLGETVAALASARPSAPPASSLPPIGPATALRVNWCFTDFPATPRPLKVAAIRSDPPPREPYSPIERLIDGAFNGSTTSCMFPPGKPASITLDLGAPQHLRELRVRAWEMHEGWKTRGLTLSLSLDGFQSDTRIIGELSETGTQSFGSNVHTIRSLLPDTTARFVRITGEPASPKTSVYLAEIEVIGDSPGEPAQLVALAAADLDGDGKSDPVIGTAGGHIVALRAAGTKLWETKVDGAVTALAAGVLNPGGKPSIVFGTGQATLGVLAADGSPAGETKPPMYRGIPSCVRNLNLADLDADGARDIVAGCDSWQYMAYSPGLDLLWKTVFYAHGATVGHVADLDGDGSPEIIAGNAYYRLQILNRRGKIVGSGSGSFGPEQTAATSGDLRGDGTRAAILGTDGGSVLAFDAKGARLWEAGAGDRITSLHCVVAGGRPRVIASSESGYVWAFDARGKPVWKRDLGEPVKRLVRHGDSYLAAASANGIVQLSLDGEVHATAAPPAPVIDLIALEGQAVALTADGSVLAVAVR